MNRGFVLPAPLQNRSNGIIHDAGRDCSAPRTRQEIGNERFVGNPALFTLGNEVEEQTFDLDHVYAGLKELTAKYDIRYDPDNPVPSDDALADRVYEAALEFFVRCGIYCKSTSASRGSGRGDVPGHGRLRGECRFGEGPDAGVMKARRPDAALRPWCHVGAGIAASTEEIATQVVRGYASLPATDSLSVPALSRVGGRPISAGAPVEIAGAIRAVQDRAGGRRPGGRPGLPILNGISAAATSLATVAASHPRFGLRASDGWIVGALPEMKTSYEMLQKIVFLQAVGANIVLAAAPFVGGYGGGPAATAVLNTAYAFLGTVLYRCGYYLSLPMHIRLGTSLTRDVIWATARRVSQAISRNTRLPLVNLAYVAGGPWTDSFFWESAAFIAASMASGASTQTPHPAKALITDHVTPLEMAPV